MNDIKVGMRVRVYHHRDAFVGKVEKLAIQQGKTYFLVKPERPEISGKLGWYHPMQCRRLKKQPDAV